MSRPESFLAACIAFLAVSSCMTPEATPEDWLDYGFRSPEQTFRSFRTAMRGDRPEREALCFSQGFREANDLSTLVYATFRDRLLEERPWLKLATRAEVEQVLRGPDHPDRARVVAQVSWLFWDETFAVDMVREEFYEVWSGDLRMADDFAAWSPVIEGDSLVVRIPFYGDFELVDATEIRVGSEWKIDGFALLTTPSP